LFGVLGWLKWFVSLVISTYLQVDYLSHLREPSLLASAILCGDSASKFKTFTQGSFSSLALIRGPIYGVVIKPQTSAQQQSTVAIKLGNNSRTEKVLREALLAIF
jgi:hypothetical protein